MKVYAICIIMSVNKSFMYYINTGSSLKSDPRFDCTNRTGFSISRDLK